MSRGNEINLENVENSIKVNSYGIKERKKVINDAEPKLEPVQHAIEILRTHSLPKFSCYTF